MSRIDESKVLAMGGVRVENRHVSLTENINSVWLETSTTSTISLTVDEARKLANELRRLARRIEKRLGEPRPEA